MYAIPLAAITPQDRPLVGNKGAALGELARAGVSVAPGFVLTTLAFQHFMAELDVDGAIGRLLAALDPDDLAAVSAITTTIRQKIATTALPPQVMLALEHAHLTLTGADRLLALAVRRSTHTSFAGLMDKHLAVRGIESVSRSVRSCWASLYSNESVTYRLRLGPTEHEVAMGVVIQRMVAAVRSGVMLTRGPSTALAIHGSWGLGSWILDDEVTPDEFVIDKLTRTVTGRTVARKLIQHLPQTDAGGVRKEAVPVLRQSAPCLTDAQILSLAEVGLQIERHFEVPQYIEWAIDAQRTPGLYILRSRPDT
ncbi:MAG TPA: PEP/pyruvate-binding domain-containing protein [Steroidobacteraceae bacterium]|nr:PEP/pyruvate-binding domain-containing protein [Steroidobacteraceae bacterium]